MTTTAQVLSSIKTAIKSCTDSITSTASVEEADGLAHAARQLAETYAILITDKDTP